MDVAFASVGAPGSTNADVVVAGPGFVVVLDGVTTLPGLDTGCLHGPGWVATRLAARLADPLGDGATEHLDDLLAAAIAAVAGEHHDDCDLGNPDSPSATVAVLRQRAHWLDYLVLCDSAILFAGTAAGQSEVITDDRTERLPAYDRTTVRGLRNVAGGFWVASTNPAAAYESVTGCVPTDRVRRALVCTDGVTRLVTRFGLTWSQLLDLSTRHPPRALIERVRAAETAGPPPPRGKRHDDATVAYCDFPPPGDR